jgi:lipopolysaccharide/colanic/teichoic acid biosynthesis glycosyltransferase
MTASAAGLVLLTPVFLIIAALIKLEGHGPVFFRQDRVGRGGRTFRIWKFRTMRADAEQRGGPLTVGEDPRITEVGQVLRRFKLDELPQLFNVLAGEMSLVGPRPEVARYVARYDETQRPVLELVPGITDPASIAFRDEAAMLAGYPDAEAAYLQVVMPAKIRLNLEYAGRATLGSDVALILRTIAHLGR